MDLLFKRYASPFELLDSMILADKLLAFIEEFIQAINEETNKQAMWDMYLHKVYGITFLEFKEDCERQEKYNMDQKEAENVVTKSIDILKNFNPEEVK